MFLHGEDIAPSRIPYKCKNAKFSCIQLIYNMISYFAFAKPLHFFAKRAEKGVFEG